MGTAAALCCQSPLSPVCLSHHAKDPSVALYNGMANVREKRQEKRFSLLTFHLYKPLFEVLHTRPHVRRAESC